MRYLQLSLLTACLLWLSISASARGQQTGHWNHAFRSTGSQAFKHDSPLRSAGWSIGPFTGTHGIACGNDFWNYSGFPGFSYSSGYSSSNYFNSSSYAGFQSFSGTTWVQTLPFSRQRISVSTCAPGICRIAPLLAPARSGLYTIDPCSGLLIPLEWWYYGCMPHYGGCWQPWGLFSVPISLAGPGQPGQSSASANWLAHDNSLTDPRILNQLQQQADAAEQVAAAQPQPAADEFAAARADVRESSAIERVDSLRLVSQGDDAFRRADYATAARNYHAALKLTPDQPTVWLREVHLRIAQGYFEQAVGCLKTGMSLPQPEVPVRLTARSLYGSDDAAEVLKSSERLWQWLSARPQSADRLLLVAAFEQLRAHDTVSAELITQAEQQSGSAVCCTVLRQQLQQPPAASMDAAAPLQAAADRSAAAEQVLTTDPDSAPQKSEGIVLKGRRRRTP